MRNGKRREVIAHKEEKAGSKDDGIDLNEFIAKFDRCIEPLKELSTTDCNIASRAINRETAANVEYLLQILSSSKTS